MEGCHCLGTRDWYLMHYSNPVVTEGQKHTHTQPILHKFSKEKTLHLTEKFPVFANVYRVNSARKGEQTFLKCECLLHKRCGIPCSHVLKITNEIEGSMIKVQHWKIYPVHFGSENDMLSNELMKLMSIQCDNENMGVPILEAIYHGCKIILDDW